MNKKRNKIRDLVQLLLGMALIVLLNYVASFYFTRFDLTSEKRYTLAPATKDLLKNLDDIVLFKIYLEGDFPAGFKRLQRSTRETLEEFDNYSPGNIQYQFINPSAISDQKQRNDMYRQLYKKGLTPTELQVKSKGGVSSQTLFPGAIVSYKGREVPLQLFRDQIGISSEDVLNNSIEGLEYEISNAIRKLRTHSKPSVAFIEGHGELDSLQTADMTAALSEYYSVERFAMKGKMKQLEDIKKYKAVIVAKPETYFSEQDKYIIDQYIMNGGKVMWLVDAVKASMDSLMQASFTFGIPRKLNIEDMLFKYGVRINYDLLMDVKCSAIPVPMNGKYELMPWYYFPLVSQANDHPIVNNLNVVKCIFASSIDTVGNKGVKKTPLLVTSRYTRALPTPARIEIQTVLQEPKQEEFNRSALPVAVLLEGEFESIRKNRMLPELDSLLKEYKVNFSDKSKPNKMIVVSDGDVIANIVHSTGRIYPLGYDIYTQQTYGNKNFLLNAMNYLCDDSGLLSVRSRKVELRLLDKEKVEKERGKWQFANIASPVAAILLLGFLLGYLRRRKYAK